MKTNISKREIAGLVLIVVVCWLFYAFAFENGWKQKLPRILGHLLNLLWIVIIFAIGFWSFHKNLLKKKLWSLSYLLLLIVLLTGALIEMLVRKKFYLSSDFFGGLKATFTSPFVFVLFLLLPIGSDKKPYKNEV
ncbi:MAG: hypothetical protein J0I09_08480 [Sphingobacteriia bacterium]|nr:hypothetical protein [Sphingobacteriia bacterium]